MKKLNLCIATGDRRVNLDDPAMTAIPKPKGARHFPVPHLDFFNTVEYQLQRMGMSMTQHTHALSKDGSRYFGMAEIESTYDEFSTIVGLRSSQDSRFAASIMFGNGVFVCSNLMFTGEVNIKHKHTLSMGDGLASGIYEGLQRVGDFDAKQGAIFDEFKSAKISDRDADCAIIDMVRRDIVKPSNVGKTVEQWYSPEHEEFAEDKNVWRLMNAVTEGYKPASKKGNMLETLTNRSVAAFDYLSEMVV